MHWNSKTSELIYNMLVPFPPQIYFLDHRTYALFLWSSPAIKKTTIAQLILQLSVSYSYCVDRSTDEMSSPCFWVQQFLRVTAQPSNLVCGHSVLGLELLKKVGIDLKLHVGFFRKRVAKGQLSFNLASAYCGHFFLLTTLGSCWQFAFFVFLVSLRILW